MADDKDHRLREVYNLQRDCRLNVKYWTAKLTPVKRLNFLMEYVLLATAPGSAIAGLVFWQTNIGKNCWMVLTSITAGLSIAKPLLGVASRIGKLQEIVVEYRSTESLLQELSNDVKNAKRYSPTMRDVFKGLQRQYDKTKAKEPVEETNEKLRDKCESAVNQELPASLFYFPPETD